MAIDIGLVDPHALLGAVGDRSRLWGIERPSALDLAALLFEERLLLVLEQSILIVDPVERARIHAGVDSGVAHRVGVMPVDLAEMRAGDRLRSRRSCAQDRRDPLSGRHRRPSSEWG